MNMTSTKICNINNHRMKKKRANKNVLVISRLTKTWQHAFLKKLKLQNLTHAA